MDNTNIILRMPFDEQSGSMVAYDYSASRADAVINAARFVKGRNGNAIELNGNSTCSVARNVVDVLGDWTIFAWINVPKIDTGTPSKLVWLLTFKGDRKFREIEMSITPETWHSVAMVKFENYYTVYLDTQIVEEFDVEWILQGVSLNQDYYGGDYGFGLLDDVVIYDVALSSKEIAESSHITPRQQIYTIDGVDLRDYGVFVSNSDGIINRPARKTPYSVNFDNYHGEMVDLSHNYVTTRTITLSCFVKAENKIDFINRITEFERLFDKPGTRRLVLDVHPVKPLIYEVYLKDPIEIKKTWSDELMVGTFTLKLVEPEPVKRILKHIMVSERTARCTITMKCAKYCNVYWGDGSVDYDVAGDSGQAVTISHDYAKDGDYFPVITGCIDEITEFKTNAIVVWNKL